MRKLLYMLIAMPILPAFGQVIVVPAASEGGNSAPTWDSTPSPTFTAGVASSYDLAALVTDADDDSLTFTNETGCTLPTGVTIDNINGELDASSGTSAGTTAGCVFGVNDGTAATVNSSSFSIVISEASAGAGLRDEYSSLTKYYVKTDGNNALDGRSLANAWQTLQYAAANVPSGGNIILVQGGTYTINSTITFANSGTSSSAPIVMAADIDQTVIIKQGSEDFLITTDGEDYIWFDGLIIDGDTKNGRGITVGDGSDDVRIRHVTFRDWLLDGTGGSNYGAVYTGAETTNVIIEYTDFDNIDWVDNSSKENTAGIMTYRPTGWVLRYSRIYDSNINWWRNKDINHGGPSSFVHVYRNHSASGNIIKTDGANDSPGSVQYSTWKFEENLMEGTGFGIANGDTAANGTNHYWEDLLIKNNTVINSDLMWGTFGYHANQAGGMVCNNIVYRDDGGPMYTNNKPSGAAALDIEDAIDYLDYNGYGFDSDVDDFSYTYQYTPSGSQDWTAWTANEGTSGRSFDENSVRTTSPNFVDYNNGDYRLDTGSPFIDAGKDDCTTSGNDIDMGAFGVEYWLPDAGPTPMYSE